MAYSEIIAGAATVKKLKRKTIIFSSVAAVCVVISLTLFIFAWCIDTDIPTLLSQAQNSPVSISVALNKGTDGHFNTITDSFTSVSTDLVKNVAPVMSVLMIVVGIAVAVMQHNMMAAFMAIGMAGMVQIAPLMFDMGSDIANSTASDTDAEEVNFGTFIKNGDVRGFLDGVSKVSVRAGYILSDALTGKTPDKYIADNLLSSLTKYQSQWMTIGLAETVAKAEAAGTLDKNTYAGSPVAASVAAYVMSSLKDNKDIVADQKTSYAVYQSASGYEGFKEINPYAPAIEKNHLKKLSLRSFLNTLTSVFTGIGAFFLCASMLTGRNWKRSDKMISESKKLSTY